MLSRTACSDSMSSAFQLYLGDAAIMSSFSKGLYLSKFHLIAMASFGCNLHHLRSLHEQWPNERNEVHGLVFSLASAVNANHQV